MSRGGPPGTLVVASNALPSLNKGDILLEGVLGVIFGGRFELSEAVSTSIVAQK